MDTKFLKISIITPCFNRVEYIEETIKSVINQNYPNIEYIIIDGGSTDGTIEVIKKYEKHLHYWISEPDLGIYDALQKGFQKATGEIMAWINSDDKYHHGSFRIANNIFTQLTDIEWLLGCPSIFNSSGDCVKVNKLKTWSLLQFRIGDYRWIQQESVFWKRSLWLKAGSNISTKYKYASDFDLWCRFFKHSNIYSLETVISGFRIHNNQLSTNNISEYEKEVKLILKLHQIHPNSFSTKILSKLFQFNQTIQKIKLLKPLNSILNVLLAKISQKKQIIYFDFIESKWQINSGTMPHKSTHQTSLN